MKKVVIIGSTGSIGEQTIDVLRDESSIEILGLTAGKNLEKHKSQVLELNPKYYDKHLSIISFKPSALKKFAHSKVSNLEKIEGIELLRALENDLKIGTFSIKSETFSVDIKEDYLKAIEVFRTDKLIKKYKSNL